MLLLAAALHFISAGDVSGAGKCRRQSEGCFGTAAGEIKDDDMRSILLHFEPGTTRIDGFACSACHWFHPFTSAEPDGTLPRHEVDLAHARFSEHNCAEFPKINRGVPRHPLSSG
jgi:hypothetical protein